MRFKKKTEEDPILSITPLIDIVFLLLIFFMLTSHFTVASGVPIRLPKVTQNAYDGQNHEITISIDKEGQVYLKDEKTDINVLGEKLKSLVENRKLSQLVLQADREALHGIVVKIMDLAKSAGVSAIVIAADWEPQEEP